MSSKERAFKARAMRNRGYRDAVAGRPAAQVDKDYQEGWRNGMKRRAEIRRPLTEEG